MNGSAAEAKKAERAIRATTQVTVWTFIFGRSWKRQTLPARLAGEGVLLAKQRTSRILLDPCRLVRQVKKSWRQRPEFAERLVHLPGELAGVLKTTENAFSLTRLVHLPGEVAGVVQFGPLKKLRFR